jgi:tripartite-type tricarboxylate transporter receptor subunit TctC
MKVASTARRNFWSPVKKDFCNNICARADLGLSPLEVSKVPGGDIAPFRAPVTGNSLFSLRVLVEANRGAAMKLLHRRRFLHLATGAVALPAVARVASAQAYPARPVRLLIGFAAGGTQDVIGRLLGQWLSERLGQQVIIENRPGAASNIAAEAALRSPPDGYTLFMIGPNNAINASVYEKLSFDIVRDAAPVAGIMRVPNVMEVTPSVPVTSVPELIAYAKANPGKINFASGGVGTSVHVSGELFKMMTGVNMQHVTYRGAGPALTDLLAGQVQLMFDNLPSSVEHIRAGKLRALAVTTATRSEALPDIPTVADFVPGYEASAFFGIIAPKNTPPEIIGRLNTEINAILADPKAKARLAGMGGTGLPGPPAEFGQLLATETEKWAKVVKFAGIKVE